MWWSQFRAALSVKNCAEDLDPRFGTILPAIDVTMLDLNGDPGKAHKKAKKRNVLAMSYLMLAMNSPKMLKMIEAVKRYRVSQWIGVPIVR